MNPHEAMTIANLLNDLITSISAKQEHAGKNFNYYDYTFQTTNEFLIENLREAKKTVEKEFMGSSVEGTPDYKKGVIDLLLAVQLPGIESIEVDELNKKFVAHYSYHRVPTFHDRLLAEPKLTKE